MLDCDNMEIIGGAKHELDLDAKLKHELDAVFDPPRSSTDTSKIVIPATVFDKVRKLIRFRRRTCDDVNTLSISPFQISRKKACLI